MKCVVCLTLGSDAPAVMVVQGNSVCAEHADVIGLSRAASERIHRFALAKENDDA